MSGTPEQFVLHIRSAIHACKQMGLDAKFAETEQTVIHAELETELAKEEYVKLRSSEKKRNKGNKPKGSRSEVTNPDSEALAAAKAACEKALKAIETSKLAVTTAGAKLFELYRNLLSNEAH